MGLYIDSKTRIYGNCQRFCPKGPSQNNTINLNSQKKLTLGKRTLNYTFL